MIDLTVRLVSLYLLSDEVGNDKIGYKAGHDDFNDAILDVWIIE